MYFFSFSQSFLLPFDDKIDFLFSQKISLYGIFFTVLRKSRKKVTRHHNFPYGNKKFFSLHYTPQNYRLRISFILFFSILLFPFQTSNFSREYLSNIFPIDESVGLIKHSLTQQSISIVAIFPSSLGSSCFQFAFSGLHGPYSLKYFFIGENERRVPNLLRFLLSKHNWRPMQRIKRE